MPRIFVSLTTVLLALLASASCAALGHAEKPGIEGRVQLSPSCLGPQRIDQPACVSAMPGAVVVLQTPHGKVVHKSATDSGGFFSFAAPPGNYVVHVEVDGMYPRCPDQEVLRVKGKTAAVLIACDSGMR